VKLDFVLAIKSVHSRISTLEYARFYEFYDFSPCFFSNLVDMEKFSLSLFNIVSVLSLFAALLFIFQLYFLKTKNLSNYFFSFYLIVVSVIVSFFLILDLGFQKVAIGLLPFFVGALLSIGPVLWLYVNSAVGGKKINALNHLLTPIIIGTTILLLLSLSVIFEGGGLADLVKELSTYLTFFAITAVFIFQSGYYIFQSLKLYKRHLERVADVFSYTEQVNLSWLKLLVYGYVVFISCLVLANVLEDLWSDLLFHFVLFGYIVFSGFNALKHEPVFSVLEEEEKDLNTSGVDVKSDFFVQLKRLLEVAMVEDRLYLDDALTIHSLSTQLETNSKYLSQLINNEFNKSFVVYVNEFRVEEAKRLLLDKDNKHLTIEAIGYEAGFKSKSAFNAVFKKNTGETPSSFLKKEK